VPVKTKLCEAELWCIVPFCNVTALAEQTEYAALMATLVINGFFRGATLINFTLTISEHCSLEKLPAAFGLHMVAKGLFIAALGPLIGENRSRGNVFSRCFPLNFGVTNFN
jgi:hypothetical protein